jgi:hypothetical protein
MQKPAVSSHENLIMQSTQRIFLGLKEGGFDLSDHVSVFSAFGGDVSEDQIELVRVERVTYTLKLMLDGKFGENREPLYGRISAELMLNNSSTGVTIARRTDRDHWEGETVGTLSLPTGHALAELAHGPKFLNLARERQATSITNEHRLFLSLMELGRVFRADL